MAGFKDTMALIERWNEKAKKLTGDDVMDLAIALSKASKAYRKKGGRRMSIEERCGNLVKAFEKSDNRLPSSRVKTLAGKRSATSVMQRLRYKGYGFRLEHEFHGNRAVSFYVLVKEGQDFVQ